MISESSTDRYDLTDSTSSDRYTTVIRPPSLSLFGIGRQLLHLAHYRDLIYTLSVHRVKVRYKQSVLGIAWAVLQPLALMLIYTVVFSLIVRMPSDNVPYAIFAYTALLPWTFFATALSNSANGLVSHAQLVTKVYFPREILPITYIVAAIFDLIIGSIVMVVLLFYYGIALTANAFYLLPILIVLTCFTTAMALFLSATQVHFRDIGVAMPLLLQLWMFATPVVYPLSAVPMWLRGWYQLNPMVGVIENIRRAVLQGAPPDFRMLGFSAVVSILLLVVSYVYFKRVEATLADVI